MIDRSMWITAQDLACASISPDPFVADLTCRTLGGAPSLTRTGLRIGGGEGYSFQSRPSTIYGVGGGSVSARRCQFSGPDGPHRSAEVQISTLSHDR